MASLTLILAAAVVAVGAIALVIVVLWLVMRHRKQRSNGREPGGEKRGRRVGSRRHRRASAASLDYDLTDRRPAVLAVGTPV